MVLIHTSPVLDRSSELSYQPLVNDANILQVPHPIEPHVIYFYYCYRESDRSKPGRGVDLYAWATKSYAAFLEQKHPATRFTVQVVEVFRANFSEYLNTGFRAFVYVRDRAICGTLEFEKMGVKDENRFKSIVVVGQAGEVFEGAKKCENRDIVFDRTVTRKSSGGCATIHYIQGLEYNERNNSNYRIADLCQPPKKRNKKDKLAMLATARLIKGQYHPAHALVRSSLFRLLTLRFPSQAVEGTKFIKEIPGLNYTSIDCGGSDVDITQCKRSFKFSIDMENSAIEGYVSEKIFTGMLANTVPIYAGAPDVTKYVNPDRFVHCNISANRLRMLNKMKTGRYEYKFDPLVLYPTKQQIHLQATAFLEEDLKPCLDEVEMLMKDDELYQRKLNAPVFNADICQSPHLAHDVGRHIYEALPELKI